MAGCLAAVGRYAEAEGTSARSWIWTQTLSWPTIRLADLYAARRMFAEALPFAEKVFLWPPGTRQALAFTRGCWFASASQIGEKR